MIFHGEIIEIDATNFKTQFPRKLSNRIVVFNSDELIGDNYNSNFSYKHIITGYENYNINGKTHNISSGQSLFIDNNSKVVVESKGKGLAVFIERELIEEIFFCWSNSNNYNLPFNFGDKSMKLQIIEKLKFIISNDPNVYVNEEFFYFFAEEFIFQQLKYLKKEDFYKELKLNKDLLNRLQIAKNYILDHAAERITLDDLALISHISKYHFLRTFKKIYGMTPIKMHFFLKIKKAKEYMNNDSYTISEISELLKYPDVQSFSRQFRLHMGITPSEYKTLKFID